MNVLNSVTTVAVDADAYMHGTKVMYSYVLTLLFLITQSYFPDS